MDLQDLRNKIDALDVELVTLLNERTKAAKEIGRRKASASSEVFVPSREQEVLKRVVELNEGPLDAAHVRAIYREIMSASISLEGDVKIAFLGPISTYSHQAALSRFGNSVGYLPCETFSDVVLAVETGRAQYGVLPVENSIEGAVTQVQDLLTNTDLKICAEQYLQISHCLIGQVRPDELTRIYSNPQALAQCRKWLEEHVPKADLIPVSSTGKAAELASKEETSGAIGSSLAAELFGIKVWAEAIQDVSGNTTRFVVLSDHMGRPTGDDKTSIYFGLQHKVGALYQSLRAFEDHKLNLLKIASRPSRNKQWEYYFFADFEGHVDQVEIQAALGDLASQTTVLTVMGSYPRAKV